MTQATAPTRAGAEHARLAPADQAAIPPLPGRSPELRRIDDLGDEIAEIAAHIDAATHRFLARIREFDELGGWAEQGAFSCAHWLSWRIGLDLVTAREKVRVARALGGLPLIDDALRRGQISYAKVRAMVRVAAPENEAVLIEQARHATGSQLERICRGYRQVLASNEEDAAAGSTTPDRPAADRYLRHSRTASGMLRIVMQVHPDEGEMLLEAVRTARAAWRAEENEKLKREQRQQVRGGPPDSGAGPDADVPDDSAESSPAGTSDGIAATAGEPKDSSGDSAESSGRVTSVDALLLVAESFLERAQRGDGPTARRGGESTQLFVHLAARPRGDSGGDPAREPAPRDAGAPPTEEDGWHGELHDGSWISEETLLRVACDCGIVPVVDGENGTPLDIGRRTRSIPPSIRRALQIRDRTCRFPGCTHRIWTSGHHIKHWAQGGETKLSNLLLLCYAHHVLVHEGRFRVETGAGGSSIFRDPGGRIIEDRTAEVRIDGEGTDGITRMNRAAGLEIDTDTCCVGADPWLADLGPAVDDLVACGSGSSRAGELG